MIVNDLNPCKSAPGNYTIVDLFSVLKGVIRRPETLDSFSLPSYFDMRFWEHNH